jgi:hypothetical protein
MGLVTPVYECPYFIENIDPIETLRQIERIADDDVDANSNIYDYITRLRVYLENCE